MLALRVGFGRGLLPVSLGVAVVLAACGGESRSASHDQVPGAPGGSSSGTAGAAATGGAGGAGAGANDETEVPLLDGVPTGDCREYTDDERVALGCPASPPEEAAACDLARGVVCPYSLTTNQGSSYQDLYLCSNDSERRWSLFQERCGEVCSDGYPRAYELDAADCMSRPLDGCETTESVSAYEQSAHSLLSDALGQVIEGCAPDAENLGAHLEVDRGCPTRFSTNYEFSEAALACIRQKLESKRYACGELLPCVEYSMYFL